MKENYSYEQHANEIKKSLTVGTTCVGIVAGSVYKELKPIIEYHIKDAIHSRQRQAWLKDRLKGV